MSFAVKYLELMTQCQQDLRSIFKKEETFFGRKSKLTDESAYDLIMRTTEEWESVVNVEFEDESFSLYSYEVLFDSVEENESANDFLIRTYFDHYCIDDSEGFLTRMFSQLSEYDFNCFVTIYTTAVYSDTVNKYRLTYEELKKEYPGLLFYPTFEFSCNEGDYYESSRC